MIDVIDEINSLYMEQNEKHYYTNQLCAAGTFKGQIEKEHCDIFISPGVSKWIRCNSKG
jgi:hypothetical protein